MLNQVIRVFQQNQSKADGTVVQWVALQWLHRQQMIAAERLRGERGSYCCVSCRWPEGGRGCSSIHTLSPLPDDLMAPSALFPLQFPAISGRSKPIAGLWLGPVAPAGGRQPFLSESRGRSCSRKSTAATLCVDCHCSPREGADDGGTMGEEFTLWIASSSGRGAQRHVS